MDLKPTGRRVCELISEEIKGTTNEEFFPLPHDFPSKYKSSLDHGNDIEKNLKAFCEGETSFWRARNSRMSDIIFCSYSDS